jgi:hypothetical protein
MGDREKQGEKGHRRKRGRYIEGKRLRDTKGDKGRNRGKNEEGGRQVRDIEVENKENLEGV